MNEAIQNKANEVILNLIQSVQDASVWLAGEIPLVIQELLQWYTAKYILCIVLALLFLIPWVYTTYKSYQITDHYDRKGESGAFILLILPGGLVAIIVSIVFIASLFNLVQITVAPRIWLLEYAANLVKSAS